MKMHCGNPIIRVLTVVNVYQVLSMYDQHLGGFAVYWEMLYGPIASTCLEIMSKSNNHVLYELPVIILRGLYGIVMWQQTMPFQLTALAIH